jgi:hypothetical protein
MCLFICANPAVRQWLHQPVDHAYRKALELKPLLAADLLEADDFGEDVSVCVRVRVRHVTTRPRLARRPMLIPILPRTVSSWRASSQFEKPLEALANAWTRFLFWVGWRR